MAIEDGVVLAEKVAAAGEDYNRAFLAYQRERMNRSARVVLSSRFFGEFLHVERRLRAHRATQSHAAMDAVLGSGLGSARASRSTARLEWGQSPFFSSATVVVAFNVISRRNRPRCAAGQRMQRRAHVGDSFRPMEVQERVAAHRQRGRRPCSRAAARCAQSSSTQGPAPVSPWSGPCSVSTVPEAALDYARRLREPGRRSSRFAGAGVMRVYLRGSRAHVVGWKGFDRRSVHGRLVPHRRGHGAREGAC